VSAAGVAVAAQSESPPSEAGVPALEARGIVREYGPVTAVAGIDLSLEPGDFLTVFGPNGAGKSSLLGLLAGALRPTRGDVFLNGTRLDFGAVDWRRQIGVLSHKGFLYAQLTVEENLQFYGRLHGLGDLDERIPERLDHVRLVDRSRSLVGQLSHGMRQRLALARALLHDPDIVLLDEPYTGLDPSAASVLRGVLTELKDGRRTVVMVTHNLGEGLALANRVAIQVRGRFAWQGSPDQVDVSEFEGLYHRVVEGRA
jgi:heme exporter protein A